MKTRKIKKAMRHITGDGKFAIVRGDCIAKMRLMPENSIDAIVTDPPYGLEFMGCKWDSPTKMNDSGPQSNNWHDDHGKTPYARRQTPRYAGKKLGNKAPEMQAFQQWCETWLKEAIRVLKPGGHIVAFGGTRTWHRLCSAIEDAGFEIRDTLMFMHGQGFPKSMNVAKAIDATIKVGGSHSRHLKRVEQEGAGKPYKLRQTNNGIMGEPVIADRKVFSASTTEARQWEGWGTALKPAMEPVVLARKPMDEKTVAKNVLKHGTGAMNIDACRIGNESVTINRFDNGAKPWGDAKGEKYTPVASSGRWPANVVMQHDERCVCVGTRSVKTGVAVQRNGGGQKIGGGESGIYKGSRGGKRDDATYGQNGKEEIPMYACVPGCPVRVLDDQTGTLKSGTGAVKKGTGKGHSASAYAKESRAAGTPMIEYGDAGGASRFFYVAKPGKKERNAGLPEGVKNLHPTLKSIRLMEWLCKLITPPGGVILDPFAGSGTTACAARLAGFRVIGIEKDEDGNGYVNVAYHRTKHWESKGKK